MSNDFKIAETNAFQKLLIKPQYKNLYFKIYNFVYPQLKSNPFFGPNIKKLKGGYESLYRYRIGDYRLFYKVEIKEVIVFILTLKHRKDSYK